jgi:uncharacterized damage-inducible protein DinB
MPNLAANLALLSAISACSVPMLNAQANPAASYKMVFLTALDDTAKKVASLAQAMPEDKYSWRPGEGVRSVSEVYVHIAAANGFFLGPLGYKPTSQPDEKKITAKADVIKTVNQAFTEVHNFISGLSNEDLLKSVKFMRHDMTGMDVLLLMSNHLHEHLGQSIAYARTNGVVPPWSKKD